MLIDAQTLQRVVHDVCSGMLGMPLEPADNLGGEETETISGVIRVSGDWHSVLQVVAPLKTARSIASTMFAAAETDLTEDEILGAVGEVVNLIGGNLKGIVAGESALSLPCVRRSDGSAALEESQQSVAISSRCAGDPLVVRLFESAAMTAADGIGF